LGFEGGVDESFRSVLADEDDDFDVCCLGSGLCDPGADEDVDVDAEGIEEEPEAGRGDE
jgi:hypothetical protein